MPAGEPDTLVGQVVEDRYRIEAQLGAGGMGVVYRARHIKVGREVAVKVLHDHLLADPTMVERFEREAAIAARLSHRNLVPVIDVGETGGKKLMVLELAPGTNLAELIAKGPFARSRVLSIVGQLLAGLEHAHAAGLVHRDLKPENVIVGIDEHGDEVPKIVDFGIAMLRGEDKRLTATGIVLGTPQYMAPEHAQGHKVDPRSDLFSLGVMVYEMLAGKPPFDGSGVDLALANITQDPPLILQRVGIAVDPLLEAFVRRLMARRMEQRFQSARAALDVLELIESHPDAAREILLPARPRTEPSRNHITMLGTPATPARLARGSSLSARAVVQRPRVERMATPKILTVDLAARDRLALASTVEAPGTPRRKQRRTPTPAKPWQPWKSIGLLAGAAIAAGALIGMAVL